MYTCKTCKLLKHSKRIFEVNSDIYHLEASCLAEALGEWHCPYYFWNTKPIGGCKHWKNMNGKHWL